MEGDLIPGRNLFKIAVIGDDGRDFDWKNFCFHPMEKVVEAMAFFGDEEKKPRFGLDRVVIPAQPKFLRDRCKTFRKVIPFKNIAVIFKQAAHKKAAGFKSLYWDDSRMNPDALAKKVATFATTPMRSWQEKVKINLMAIVYPGGC